MVGWILEISLSNEYDEVSGFTITEYKFRDFDHVRVIRYAFQSCKRERPEEYSWLAQMPGTR